MSVKTNKEHATIQENEPVDDIIDLGNYNFYKIKFKHLNTIKSIKCQVTSLHGEVSMFASFIKSLPSITKYDYLSQWNFIEISHDDIMIMDEA